MHLFEGDVLAFHFIINTKKMFEPALDLKIFDGIFKMVFHSFFNTVDVFFTVFFEPGHFLFNTAGNIGF